MFSTSVPFSAKFRPVSAISATTRTFPRIVALPSHYDILGLQIGATSKEIKSAYRRLARTVHPDVQSNSQESSSPEEFIKVHMAYSTLTDPSKRADYDRSLFKKRTYTMAGSGYSTRSWETDQCW